MELRRADRLASIFDRALAVPPAERPSFLQKECGDDAELRRELDSLLEAHESADEFFDGLAEEVIAPAAEAIIARGLSDVSGELASALEGRYRIERELSGGSMSRVFLAEELGLERRVVIKVLPPELATSMSGERFRREIQLVAQLQHPHIVPLLSAEAEGRLLYYVMPYIAGESLRDRLSREGALPLEDASRVWRDMLEALAHAHAMGVIHRDVKPGNILLSGRNALVADFGIGRAIEAAGATDVTAPGVTLGTPAYMAPEQFDSISAVDFRTDLYASALVMYEMLEGQLPFPAGSPRDVALARITGSPSAVTRPDCPPELAAFVMQCLSRDPSSRPASAEAILTRLDRPVERAGAPSAVRWRFGSGLAAAALATVLVAGVALGPAYLGREPGGITANATAGPSIAVLPVANLSAETGDASLADGMTEELVAVLSQEGNLRVVASTSVRALQRRGLDVRQIAESLHVTHVLESGLQKVGARLRMHVRLVGAGDGSNRWSRTYDREIGDVFVIQDDIARSVADELGVRLTPDGHAQSARRRFTPSVAAYELYLRGKDNALLRSAEGRQQGMEYLHEAIAIDSGFAAARAALVWLYLNEAGSAPGNHREWYSRAEAAALEATRLDESLADAHSALGWARLQDPAAAEVALKRAVALDPAAHRGYEGLARLYMITRRPAEQLAAAGRGLAIDPYSVAAIREMALAFSTSDRCNEALQLLAPLKDLDPPAGVAGVIRGICYARKQMWPEAIAELDWASGRGARTAIGLKGYVLGKSGRRAEAQELLSDLLAGRKQSHGAFGIALVYAGLGEIHEAFRWLEKSADEGSLRVYIMDPLFTELQRDPRFDSIWQASRET